MRQMDDNLIVRIVTIQAIVMSLLFTAATWLQLHGQHFGNQVSSLFLFHKPTPTPWLSGFVLHKFY